MISYRVARPKQFKNVNYNISNVYNTSIFIFHVCLSTIKMHECTLSLNLREFHTPCKNLVNSCQIKLLRCRLKVKKALNIDFYCWFISVAYLLNVRTFKTMRSLPWIHFFKFFKNCTWWKFDTYSSKNVWKLFNSLRSNSSLQYKAWKRKWSFRQ